MSKYRNQIVKAIAGLMISASVASLGGCSSPEEKANKFFEKGKSLLEQGKLGKARVEFRNAIQLNKNLTGAWFGLAEVAERRGDWNQMFGFLNKVLDRQPNHLPANLKLGRLLLAAGKLDRALAISDVALKIAPDDPSVLALRAAVLYKLEDKRGAVETANAALKKDPNNVDALVVLATERLAAKDGISAIAYLDRGLKQNERNIALQLVKVQALESLAKLDSAEEVFRKLVALYPETRQLRHILAQFYLSHGRKDDAEAQYRTIVVENPKDMSAQLDLVRFLGTVKGPSAAILELEQQIAKNPAAFEYKFALAELRQSQREDEAAASVLRSIISEAGDTQDGIRAKGLLAANLLASGKRKESDDLVRDILVKDQRNEMGLLLKASMEVDDRKFDQAIADLRTILRDTPNSPRALTMLGRAHELAGSVELAQEQYLKAFNESGSAAQFGMPYAQFLLRRGQSKRAETVLVEVLRTAPRYIPALKLLAQTRITAGDFAGAQAVVDNLKGIENAGADSEQIQGALLAAKKNYSDSISTFKRAYDASPSDVRPLVSLIQTYVLAGRNSEAIAFLNAIIRSSPDNATAYSLLGQLKELGGKPDEAVQAYKAVIGLQPKEAASYAALASLHARQRKFEEAKKVVGEGLKENPNDFALQLEYAGMLELTGQFDEAILAYERLLKERPNADVVANNLAGLLVEHRKDKASLEKAHRLASRFSRSEIPQFKDTLGWTNYKLGKADDAARMISDATRTLDLPVFRYHLGMSYLALQRKGEARKELEKALLLGGDKFLEAGEIKEVLKDLK